MGIYVNTYLLLCTYTTRYFLFDGVARPLLSSCTYLILGPARPARGRRKETRKGRRGFCVCGGDYIIKPR